MDEKKNKKHKAQMSRWQSKTLLGGNMGRGKEKRRREEGEGEFLKREGKGAGKAARESSAGAKPQRDSSAT